mmetsp:Transcript_345/g.993  ORF Transcript_345/g.993 Transcript_345/m.993 type:complete len:555 (+) Transcript_345:262-1926(+)
MATAVQKNDLLLANPANLEVSVGQAACLLGYTLACSLWAYTEFSLYVRRKPYEKVDHVEEEGKEAAAESGTADGGVNGRRSAEEKPVASYLTLHSLMNCGLVKCLQLDLETLAQNVDALKSIVEFGTILLWFYVADRSSLLFPVQKEYLRDRLAFVFLTLVVVAGWTSTNKCRVASLLNRQQTEEWKGWMQVLFLLYHYFAAAEMYNFIRILIAAYVWMTGFGNFLYYHKTNDFSIVRFCQMMWRLNFLVVFTCIVMRNDYMLYYICPMHTIFTIGVYASLGIGRGLNKHSYGIAIKIVGALLTILVFWDIRAVFFAVWKPFTWLVGYRDPRKPDLDVLHEWYFRSSLDRYVWIFGMVCAWAHPYANAALEKLDGLQLQTRVTLRAALLAVVSVLGYFWYTLVFTKPKLEYNTMHPYTSWIPILCWIVARNLTPTLRNYSLGVFGWLGCITLETYIGQFHTWLSTGIPNGQPKMLLNLFWQGYPLINFAICSALYVFLSFRLFNLTNDLKNVAIPGKDINLLMRNSVIMLLAALVLCVAGFVLLELSSFLGVGS